MFKNKVNTLIKDFHVKKIALVNLIDSNKVSFDKKLKDNSFEPEEEKIIMDKYGALL